MEVVAPGASDRRRVFAPVPQELSSALKRCR
jgi:hypothetical protein